PRTAPDNRFDVLAEASLVNEGLTHDNPGTAVRPPRLYLGALVAGIVLGLIWSAPIVSDAPTGRIVVGLAIVAAGVWLMSIAMKLFSTAGTNVPTHLPVTALVTDGPYRYTRNPIYVALTLIYVGLAVLANTMWALVLLVPVLAVMHYGVVAREEAYLERKFGADYAKYREQVARWL
ncbi:MAG: methyltransferase family protein, partial [Candidatus Binataceae bacterium]